ncbi:fascin-like isoform X2 [Watersipora subatra]|uniref:fascin-like isoform X2 n=1 Tax=Watersipora subatra TaxID=2589382 RepID=UPI00355B8EC3
MTSNGSNPEAFSWKFGFANQKGKYLTAEKFGFKLNASGAALKAKQVWVLEHGQSADEVYIRSSQKRYLATDKYGNLTCDSEERGECQRFLVEYNDQGQWAFKSVPFSYYMYGEEDNMHCKSKTAEWWHIQLAIHPQVNLYNTNRKRYCHMETPKSVEEQPQEVHGCQLIPWGSQAMITLDYIENKYAIQMCDGRYLHPDGSLQASSEGALYTLQVKSGGIAFRSNDGKFLTNIGSTATLKARNSKVTKDELFLIKDSQPQVTLTGSNGKRVSIMQGIDVSSNQDDDELSEKDIFQLEFDSSSKKWKFLASNGKYWVMKGVGVQANGEGSAEASLFELEQLANSTIALKAPNGKYVTIKMTGALNCSSDSCGDKEKFKMTILNRPIMILKGEFGFLGLKNNKIEANRPTYDAFELKQAHNGLYNFKGSNGKYWTTDGGQVMCVGEQGEATGFQLELLGNSRIGIKTADGNYLRGENNGVLTASAPEIKNDSKYEF